MSIFSKFFGKNSNRVTNQFNGTQFSKEQKAQLPNEDLFVENQAPQTVIQSSPSDRHKKISVFLQRDFEFQGKRDGYLNHSSENKELTKKSIRSSYLNLLDEVMQEVGKNILALSNKLQEVNEFKSVSLQIQNTLSHLDDQLATLKLQKELTVENEGWLMSALNMYDKGYALGVQDYIIEKDFLGTKTIL